MRVDLHLHTWISDGAISPAELVRRAAACGLDLIAITDHDTAAGVIEACSAAVDFSLTVVPGIEISTWFEDREHHILGYWIDPMAEAVAEHQNQALRRRSDRMDAMVERLQGLGLEITVEDVREAAGPFVRALGRPHLARALHARRQTRYYGEAFTRYIGDSGPAFVAEGFPSPEEAIAIIHAAGGKAVWAHPMLDRVDELVPMMRRWGLDGIECYRPGVAAGDTERLVRTARSHDLLVTGGSDWHSPNAGNLGEFWVDATRVRPILEVGGIQVV